MKKVLLGCVTCLLALGLVTACEEEEDVVDEGNTSTEQETTESDGTTPSTPSEPKTYDHYFLVGDFTDANWSVSSTSPYYLALSEEASENYWEFTVTTTAEPDYGEYDPWKAGLRVVNEDWGLVAGSDDLTKWSDSNLYGDDEKNVKLEWNASYDVTIDLREEEPKLTVALVDTYSRIAQLTGEDPSEDETYYLGFTDGEGATQFTAFTVGDSFSFNDEDLDEYKYYEVSVKFVSLEEATPVHVTLTYDTWTEDPGVALSIINETDDELFLAFDDEDLVEDDDGNEYQPLILTDDIEAPFAGLSYLSGGGFICTDTASWYTLAVNENSEDDELYFFYDEAIDDEDYDEFECTPIYLYGTSSDFDSHYEVETNPEDGRGYYLGYLDDDDEPMFVALEDTTIYAGQFSVQESVVSSISKAAIFTVYSVDDGITLHVTIGEYEAFLEIDGVSVNVRIGSETITTTDENGESIETVETYEPGVFNIDPETGYLTFIDFTIEDGSEVTATYVLTINGDDYHQALTCVEESKLGEDEEVHPLQLLYSVRDFA